MSSFTRISPSRNREQGGFSVFFLAKALCRLPPQTSCYNTLQDPRLTECKQPCLPLPRPQRDVTGQPLHPYVDAQMASNSLPNSSSEMCLRSHEEQAESRSNMRKHSSMGRLPRDGGDAEGVSFYGSTFLREAEP